MKLDLIKAAVTSKAARQLLVARKYSPQALFVAGTVGVIGATVLACRATLQVPFVLDDHDKSLADAGEAALSVGTLESDETKREVAKLKLKTALTIGKLYAPSVALGVASIAALTGSQVILTKRNTAVMAAYAGLDRAYREYRKRVVSEYGEEVERKLFSGGDEDVAIEEKTAEGGVKTKKGKKRTKPGASPYAALFDEKSKLFTREPGMNGVILGIKQTHMNDKLRAQGHLFLNEVLDELDLPRTPAGALVGWVWNDDPNNENAVGDNFVSFGIYENEPGIVDAFMASNNPIWLDFNVDGVIYDKI